jgi:hypothetical protein
MIDEWRKLKAYYYGTASNYAPMRIWLPIEMGEGNIYREIDTLEKCRDFVRRGPSYSLKRRPNKEGTIWDMSDLSDLDGVDLI